LKLILLQTTEAWLSNKLLEILVSFRIAEIFRHGLGTNAYISISVQTLAVDYQNRFGSKVDVGHKPNIHHHHDEALPVAQKVVFDHGATHTPTSSRPKAWKNWNGSGRPA